VYRFTGDVEWEFDPPNDDFLHASCGVADGLVFWGDSEGYSPYDSTVSIHAVDAQTGTEVWNYTISIESIYGVLSSPSIVDGVMYIGAGDGNLYAFGTGLKYTYLDDLFAYVGSNELIATSFDGGVAVAADTISFTVTGTGIGLEPSPRLSLCASPNPFYCSASISFELSEPGFTSIEIYDLSGRIVSIIENSELQAGGHLIQWNGRNQDGETVSAGLYFCRIQSGGIFETTGLCLLR